MSETIYSYSYYQGAYSTSGSYVSNAYLFEVEGILETVDQVAKTASVTIKWYITGKNNFSYNGYSGINTSIAVRYNGEGDYITKANSTMGSCTPTNTKYLMLSAKVECSLTSGKAFTINYKNFYDGGESKNYLPRLHTQYGNITIPAQQFNIPVYFNQEGTVKQTEKMYTNSGGVIKEVVGIYYNDNGTIKTIQ